MRIVVSSLAAVVLPLLAVSAAGRPPDPAAVLRGRVAGAPSQCIPRFPTQESTTILPGAIVFREGSRTFLNRPEGACPFRQDSAFRTVTPSSQLCRGDIATFFDPVSGIVYGSCPLGAFVPYVRPGK